MKTLTVSLITLLASSMYLTGCAHGESKKGDAENPKNANAPVALKKAPDAGSSIEAKQLAATEQATYVTEIKFAKAKAVLTAEAQSRLKKIFEQAKGKGAITEIKEIAWADAEFPSIHTVKLPKAQLDLANKRNEAISNYFKSLGADASMKISAYSMAERTNVVADLVGTADAQIKKSLEVAGIPNTDTSSKVDAKASKAIVMIFLK